MYDNGMVVNVEEVEKCISEMPGKKAAGPDDLCVEHFKFCSKRVNVLLSLSLTSMLVHGHLPSSLIESLLVPIVKNKCISLISKDN